MLYLDNAATSYPKPLRVNYEIYRCIRDYCANPGRGGHRISLKCGREIMNVRQILADFFNISDPLNICFTKNATEGLNICIKGCLKNGGHVITSSMEHNSVIRPLIQLENEGKANITIVKCDCRGIINVKDILNSIRNNTILIIMTASSNVNGVIFPLKEIGLIARKNNIIFMVDASQGAGNICIDIKNINADILVFPGHKSLLGPQGTGGIYISGRLSIEPLMQGGTGSNSRNTMQPSIMPDRMESGTLNTPGIIGLGYGIDFLLSYGPEKIYNYKKNLNEILHREVKKIKNTVIYSSIENNSGILAFNIKGMDSNDVSRILDLKYGIASRAGLHCAPLAHITLGTSEEGLVRLSPGCFNTPVEIEYAIKCIYNISKHSSL